MNILEYCIKKIKESKEFMSWEDFDNYTMLLEIWTQKLADREK